MTAMRIIVPAAVLQLVAGVRVLVTKVAAIRLSKIRGGMRRDVGKVEPTPDHKARYPCRQSGPSARGRVRTMRWEYGPTRTYGQRQGVDGRAGGGLDLVPGRAGFSPSEAPVSDLSSRSRPNLVKFNVGGSWQTKVRPRGSTTSTATK
jgi:hypothetical protein